MKRTELKGKKYIAFARCSTQGQADTSIEDQLKAINAFARSHEMIHVDNITLEGVTGSIPGARSDIDEMIARKVECDDFEVLLVQDPTRLTRSGPLHGATIKYQLSSVGIQLVFVTDDIPSDEYGVLKGMMLDISAQQQAKSISMGSTRGSMSALQQGRSAHCRRAPYGIDKLYLAADGTPNHIIRNLPDGTQVMLDPETRAIKQKFGRNEKTGAPSHYRKQKDERIQLLPGDERHVEVVRRIFRLHLADGWGCPRIAQSLNDDGIPSPTGGDWYSNTIRAILYNTIYTGVGIANRFSSAIYHERATDAPHPVQVDAKTLSQGKRPPTRMRPRSEWHEREESAISDFLAPEIKTMAVEKHSRHLENIADGRQPAANKDRHRESPYLLKDILTSKQGGYRMTGRITGRKPYRRRYYHVSKAYSAPRSKDAVLRKTIPAEPLEECVVAIVQGMLLRVPDIRERITAVVRQQHRETAMNDADLAELMKKREELAHKLEFALDALDDIGRDATRAKIKRWQTELRSIDEQMRRAQPASRPKDENIESTVEVIMKRVTELGRSMDNMSNVGLRRLIKTMVHRAVVDLETRTVELELRLPSWLMDGPEPMCLDANFGCKHDIETHHENGIPLMRMRLIWIQCWYTYGGIDFADAA